MKIKGGKGLNHIQTCKIPYNKVVLEFIILLSQFGLPKDLQYMNCLIKGTQITSTLRDQTGQTNVVRAGSIYFLSTFTHCGYALAKWNLIWAPLLYQEMPGTHVQSRRFFIGESGQTAVIAQLDVFSME